MPRKNSKTAFVLSFATDTSAKAVVAAGKTKGIALTEAYVYGIRSRAKRKGSQVRMKGEAIARKVRGGNAEVERFAALALNIGLSKAGTILEKLRSSLAG